MLTRQSRAYVDPFDRICHGLRGGNAPATTDPKEVRGKFSRFTEIASLFEGRPS